MSDFVGFGEVMGWTQEFSLNVLSREFSRLLLLPTVPIEEANITIRLKSPNEIGEMVLLTSCLILSLIGIESI